jgi:hypothetical protein
MQSLLSGPTGARVVELKRRSVYAKRFWIV